MSTRTLRKRKPQEPILSENSESSDSDFEVTPNRRSNRQTKSIQNFKEKDKFQNIKDSPPKPKTNSLFDPQDLNLSESDSSDDEIPIKIKNGEPNPNPNSDSKIGDIDFSPTKKLLDKDELEKIIGAPIKTNQEPPKSPNPNQGGSPKVNTIQTSLGQNASQQEDEGSSSDSSVENYLKPAHEIDLDSSFFNEKDQERSGSDDNSQKTSGNKKNSNSRKGLRGTKSAVELYKKRRVKENVGTLSDSEDEKSSGVPQNLCGESPKSGVKEDSASDSNGDKSAEKMGGDSGFESLENYHKKLEEAKKAVETYKNRKFKEEKVDIKKLLSVGETQMGEKLESSYISGSSDDEMDWDDLEKQAAVTQATSEIPKEGVSITIETQTVQRKKKQDDYLMQIRRRLNRVRKENQVFMHKVHILCWIAHGNYVNSILNSENLLARSLSLIPNENCYPPQRADLQYLEKITKWYSKNIKIVEKVTEKIPTISLERILQVQIAKKEASSKKNYVLIFICILRALGLQCRLILSLRTLPLRPPQSELCSLSTKHLKTEADESSKDSKNTSGKEKSDPKASSSKVSKEKSIKTEEDKKSSKVKVEKNAKKELSSSGTADKAAARSRRSFKLGKTEEVGDQKTEDFKEVVIKVERMDMEESASNSQESSKPTKSKGTSLEVPKPRSKSTSVISPENTPEGPIKTKSSTTGRSKTSTTKTDGEKSRSKSTSAVTPEKDSKNVDPQTSAKSKRTSNRSKSSTTKIDEEKSRSNSTSAISPEKDSKNVDPKASAKSQRTSNRSKASTTKTNEEKSRSKSTSAVSPEKQTKPKSDNPEISAKSQNSTRSKSTSLKTIDQKSRSKSTSAISLEKKEPSSDDSKKIGGRSKETSLKTNDSKSRSKSTSEAGSSKKVGKKNTASCSFRKSSMDLSDYTSEDEFKPDRRSLNSSRTSLGGFSPKNDVRGDIISILKGDLLRSKQVQRSKLVRKSHNSDSDSDYMPEPVKKARKSDSSDDFKQKKSKNSSTKIKQRVKPKSVLEKEEKEKLDAKNRRVLSSEEKEEKEKIGNDVWCEVFLEAEEKWISVDVIKGQVHCVSELHSRASTPITYILAWNNNLSIKDVTSRYCPHMNTITRKLRVDPEWWNKTLKPYLGRKTIRDKEEDEDLARQQLEQPLPKTIMEYKNHPLYALKRHLLKFEAIYPPDAVTLGFIRNEPVYARECVHTLHSREIWIKHAKVVKPNEQPYKIVKARPKYDKLSGQMITDKPLEIFGPWQVEDYVPPRAENGVVPRNAFGNVELFKPCMLPGGTVHLQLPGLNKICRRLQIDCAPALIGFDYHSGGSHPTFDGYIVCEEYKDKLIKAWEEEQEEIERREQEKIETRVYGNWKKLIKGLLIREKLKNKYGFETATGSGKSKKKTKGPRFVAKKRRVVSDSESSS